MDSIVAFFSFIEKYPVTGTALLALVGAGIIGIIKAIINRINEKSKSPYVKPSYFGFSKNFYITIVHEFFPDNSPNAAGYKQVQYSRPDQWQEKVVKASFFGLFHKIIPTNEKAILTVLVRKNGKEKHINFNRPI